MTETSATLPRSGFGATSRRDPWWMQPAEVFSGLGAFLIYATWAAFQGTHYHFGPYLSPFYSPELFGDSPHAWFGPKPGFWPSWMPWSPAFLILWAPGAFRVTCYYYRGAYYKAFAADPPSCAVAEPRKKYTGEMAFPLVLQNAHRYAMYLALLFIVVLSYDVWHACWFENPATGATQFGIGLGTILLAVNVVCLSCYTLGCHSLRHLLGGRNNQLSRSAALFAAYRCASCLNRKHMAWAWTSLFTVGFSDVYIRLCSMGVWTDWRIL